MRHRASVIIPAWNEWSLTRACLESLRPTLGVRDEVIVVDNGSTDGTADGLRRCSWVKVVSHPENLGFAAGCNSGAAVASGDVLVFLDNETVVPSRWLDGLLRPFADPTVGATGPRSNSVSGPQLVEQVPYAADRTADLQRFARTWRQEHSGQTTDVTGLAGFCLAVREDLFAGLGGFDETVGLGGAEDDDLCLRITDSGHRLLITHETFVHRHGHRTSDGDQVDGSAGQDPLDQQRRPLVSACMIVKDEADNLPACLDAATALADEIVVYDTGSTDDSVAIARAAGATVVEGYWDDDFGRARNAALEHCTGTWILHVDADEIVVGPLDTVLTELQATQADSLAVRIDNVEDTGVVGLSHTAVRLFRRQRARWSGALHEQVVSLNGTKLTLAKSSLTLEHTGYTSSAMQGKDKNARNLRVARAAAERSGGGDPLAAINLGRSLRSSGEHEAALAQFRSVVESSTSTPVLRQARRYGAEALISVGRSREALDWIEALRSHTSSSSMPDYLAATASLNLMDVDAAVRLLEPLLTVADEDFTVPDRSVHERRGLAFAASQRWAEAAVELASSIRAADVGEGPWAELVESQWRSGAPLADLVELLPVDDHLVRVLGRVANAAAPAADAFAEVLWSTECSRAGVLALAGRIGDRLELGRALEWSVRLRAHGADRRCTVAALAENSQRPALERLRACGVLVAAFDDVRGRLALPTVAAAVETDDFGQALHAIDQLAPALLPVLVRTATGTERRRAAMHALLEQIGAADAARELLGQPA